MVSIEDISIVKIVVIDKLDDLKVSSGHGKIT